MKDPAGQQKCVLVVEDDPIFGPELKDLLEGLAPAVDLVECVDDAVNKLKAKHYDLLVLDNWLPKPQAALPKKKVLEQLYDDQIIEMNDRRTAAQRKVELREQMKQTKANLQDILERHGGLMVMEDPAVKEHAPGAILILTAIGNEDMRDAAEGAARSTGCSRFCYLVKPQSPEDIEEQARTLLYGK